MTETASVTQSPTHGQHHIQLFGHPENIWAKISYYQLSEHKCKHIKRKKSWFHSSSTAPHFNRVYTYYISYICVSGTFRKKQAPQQYLMLFSWVQNEIPTYWLEQPSGNINVIFQMRNPFLFSACIPPVVSWAVAYSLIWTLEMLKQL